MHSASLRRNPPRTTANTRRNRPPWYLWMLTAISCGVFVVGLIILAHRKFFVIAAIILSLMGLPSDALASCTTHTVYGPDGSMRVCQTCCNNGSCQTFCS